jgi:hypothetical protein
VAEVFVSKVRCVGSSLGLLIPKEIVESEHLSKGKEVRVSIVCRDFSRLEELFGSAKGAGPFIRDRRDRLR